MAFKLKPKTFTSRENFNQVSNAAAHQTGKRQTIKSTDPVHFPVFEIPINKKVLIYVPNHRVMSPEGIEEMRMDKGDFHPVTIGGQYMSLRCYSGIFNEDEGYNGTCPLCNTQNEIWELYRKEYAEIAHTKGIDPENDPDDLLKPVRQDLTRNMVVKAAEKWYTFPIVVIECDEGTVNPKKDKDGKLIGTPMWYTIREQTYRDKWEKAFDTMPDSPTHPAGNWFILNFTYESKSGKHDRMGSARSLQVGYKQMSQDYVSWADYYNQITEEWDAFKASETVIANQYLELDNVEEIANEAMKPVRQKLDMFALKETGLPKDAISGVPANAEQTLASFGATEVAQDTGAGAGALPVTPTAITPTPVTPSPVTGDSPF